MGELRLEELSASTIVAVNNMSLKPGQEEFLSPVSYGIAATVVNPQTSWQRVVLPPDSQDELRPDAPMPEVPDELILRASVPQADIDKMRAAGPVRRDYPLLSTPELEQVRKLMGVATMPVVEIKSAGLELSLRR